MQKEDMITAEEFCKSHHVEILFIQELEQYGLVETTIIEETKYVPLNRLQHLEKVVRMHFELGINVEGIDAINHLLQRVEDMQQQINTLRNKLNFYKDEEE